MRWQILVAKAEGRGDPAATHAAEKLVALGLADSPTLVTRKIYVVEGDLDQNGAETLARELFQDPVTERAEIWAEEAAPPPEQNLLTVFRKPGVMDPAEAGILRGAARLGLPLKSAATGISYRFLRGVALDRLEEIAYASLANAAVDRVILHSELCPKPGAIAKRSVARVVVPLRAANDEELSRISKEGGLSLTLIEMQAIAEHFRILGREPTEIELESLAQTWSEHCKHKTLAGRVRYAGAAIPNEGDAFEVDNLLKRTIKAATEELDRPFCLSVFHDNAGVISFTDDMGLCIKVETHNHPSAIEPYGGAGTGLGGVIRDILGTGLGAKPVANLDVFCVAPPDTPDSELPRGTIPPKRILEGVVAGVRDYGNQMGIPTVSGAVLFDPRYVGNPLVYCGTVGLLPTSMVHKSVQPGDRIVAIGGHTGRDGIHGATFSSVELHEASETMDSGAVQIGNAITEKKVLDVLLKARDLGLYRAVTDCGAGGFSSAIGEMGEALGAEVHLERAPLKYAGLSPTEIWISEAQERMVLAVPPAHWPALLELAQSEDLSAVDLGEFTASGHLKLYYEGELLGDLAMAFLHDGLPKITREAEWQAPPVGTDPSIRGRDAVADLLALLADPNVASKEWIIRQYDHEVQGGSVIKPLVGTAGQGPSDGAVQAPLHGETVGFALGLGMNPWVGDRDPYVMAWFAIDEALRNVVAVGGDPNHCAILDNFSWGNTSKPDRLGGLVRAAYGCRDAALCFETPFISGKDSLNNEYRVGDRTIAIPPSLLVTALARVPDVRRAISMDFKRTNSRVYALGVTCEGLAGSLYARHQGVPGQSLPPFDGPLAKAIFSALHTAITKGLVLAAHDLSDGGLAVAAAEMVLAGEIGADLDLDRLPTGIGHSPSATERLFGEGPSRFLLEVAPEAAPAIEQVFRGLPLAFVGETFPAPVLILRAGGREPLIQCDAQRLEAAFRGGLTRSMTGKSPLGGPSHG